MEKNFWMAMIGKTSFNGYALKGERKLLIS